MTDYRNLSLWFDQLAEPLTAAGAADRSGRRRRRDRRRRVHRSVDGLLPAAGPTRPADRGRRARDRRVRRLRAQRRLVLGALPGRTRRASRLRPGTPPPSRSTAAMRDAVTEVAEVAAAESIDADIAKGGTIVLARSEPQLARARDEVAESRGVRPRHHDCSTPPRRAPGSPPPTCSARPTRRTAPRSSPAALVRGLADAVVRSGRAHLRADPARSASSRTGSRTPAGDVRARFRGPRHRGLHPHARRRPPRRSPRSTR